MPNSKLQPLAGENKGNNSVGNVTGVMVLSRPWSEETSKDQ